MSRHDPLVMPAPVRALLAASGAAAPRLALPTGTRVDVGLWFRGRQVWAACTAQALVLAAAGERPFTEIIPLTTLGGSLYNAVTGEVNLAPAPGIRIRNLKLDPVQGRRLIEMLTPTEKETNDA